MQSKGYIGEFEIVDDHASNKIVVELLGNPNKSYTGRLNKCAVISPRYDVTLGEFEQWTNNVLPARYVCFVLQSIRQFGYVVLTTNVGILTHDEARERHVGGKVLGFFYWSCSPWKPVS